MAGGGLLPEHVPWLVRAGVRDGRLAAVLEVEFNLRITADGFQLTA